MGFLASVVLSWPALGLLLLSLLLPAVWMLLRLRQPSGLLTTLWAGRIARFFYFVGIPYLAVIFGLLTPRFLGLRGLEHLATIGDGSQDLAMQLQHALTLLLLEWLLDSPATLAAGGLALLLLGLVWQQLQHSQSLPALPHQSAISVVYLALHWAFYRGLIWFATGSLYSGVVLGVLLVLLEWLLLGWATGRPKTELPLFWMQLMLLVLTATVFFYSPNLWLLLPIHGAMAALLNSAPATNQLKTAQV